MVPDKDLDFTEGSVVRFYYDDVKVFKGYVFSKTRNSDNIISVVAYDQLRYLKNRDTINYINMSLSEVIKKIANNFSLDIGCITESNYKITRIERSATLFNIIVTAIELTFENTKEEYIFYDDFGKLTLENIKKLKTNVIISENSAEDFTYSTSIDIDTYNKIVLLPYEINKEDNPICPTFEDAENINKWGVLQLVESVEKEENQYEKLKSLQKIYNRKSRDLSIQNNIGNINVRGGSLVYVKLNLGEIKFEDYLVVQKCTHKFCEGEHFMDLTLKGGELFV
ncbi:MAG: hydrolase [Lachnospirales bacterium]